MPSDKNTLEQTLSRASVSRAESVMRFYKALYTPQKEQDEKEAIYIGNLMRDLMHYSVHKSLDMSVCIKMASDLFIADMAADRKAKEDAADKSQVQH